ncbi:ABC transporter ATP-binding protein [Mesorhizobium sp. M1C.F.Ca.ET.193.01.1.1]|uniref:ABC transporter ATP-binding protein n=2 Tax=Mesorhizobium TaxID=68287 RepID=UPI000FD4F2D9|nr:MULTISPECIES: ABC transporter ATP-binding protein [unclassified Mesorhizobium]TGS92282.1 ABC transporter ATP-binding protein [bacterium M00.F.Ca.ET.177.01.1.1]TGQ50176.1 ABC transporter ATP-binding protein [Mesorhizobium sp. M1C.F.Ca.ET.210.01.1.1]TGQ64865.1 ABC transporter ATP-binding protein [Mesorhizobium sp. M1C.F.Ca.ET.212.01.1.1]TGQ98646.1 ABC transporter ATP-binding protein [Mesorhizobium sp. M1C.F.Ca.ET.204.01.1.1]TGR18883.1 ABC transporter ATP-binding protein [Mesorhizobium sp. M1C
MIGQALTLSRLRKSYGDIVAVNETDLEIDAGEFVSIVGPSGSGKTSLLTLIAGFEPPSSGAIRIGDKDITYLPPYLRDIGMVFQKYALFPHLTVRQNIAFPLKMRRRAAKSTIAARVEEMLELVQLPQHGDRYPSQLSGGQQQRVAVARALVFDPPVILMDEPLGALDKKLREVMQIEIKRIQERLGATVIYVTHDQEEALTLSDRVAVMHQGSLQQIGTPAELYRRPSSAFVADFIGAMNFVPGILVGGEPGKHVIQVAEGIVLKATSGGRLAIPSKGSAVCLAIRPEHIKLAPRTGKAAGMLAGAVEASIFVGPTQIVLVRPEALPGIVLRVQMPADQIAGLERGALVAVAFDEAMLQAFPARERLAA